MFRIIYGNYRRRFSAKAITFRDKKAIGASATFPTPLALILMEKYTLNS